MLNVKSRQRPFCTIGLGAKSYRTREHDSQKLFEVAENFGFLYFKWKSIQMYQQNIYICISNLSSGGTVSDAKSVVNI